MSDLSGGTSPPPATPHEAIRALLRAGKNDEAIIQLCALTVARPDDLVAKDLLFDAFYQKRDWAPALVLIEQLVRTQPDALRLQKALIATLSNMKRFEEAIAHASRYIQSHGDDLTVLDALKVANFYLGKTDEAIRHGRPRRHPAPSWPNEGCPRCLHPRALARAQWPHSRLLRAPH